LSGWLVGALHEDSDPDCEDCDCDSDTLHL
jgi:hypothetical protein